jgi:hypothetical protein
VGKTAESCAFVRCAAAHDGWAALDGGYAWTAAGDDGSGVVVEQPLIALAFCKPYHGILGSIQFPPNKGDIYS